MVFRKYRKVRFFLEILARFESIVDASVCYSSPLIGYAFSRQRQRQTSQRTAKEREERCKESEKKEARRKQKGKRKKKLMLRHSRSFRYNFYRNKERYEEIEI